MLLALVFLGGLVGYPLAFLLLQSVFPELPAGRLDGFMDAWVRMGETPEIGRLIRNSLAWAGATTGVSWILGIPCGWLLARTDLPGKLWVRLSLLVPIMTPPYIAALSWILVMQAGGFGDLLTGGIPEPLRGFFFSFWGVTLVMALSSFGYVALAVEAALSELPRRFEDAAELLGSSWRRTFVRIVLPLLLPAILNSGLLVFLDALSNFGVPAVLGTRSNLPLLPAEIFFLVTSWPVDIALATSLSSLLCLFALVSLYGSRWLGHVFGGGAVEAGPVRVQRLSGMARRASWAFVGVLFVFSSGLPWAAMVLTSLARSWGEGWPALTLAHYGEIFTPGSRGLGAIWTSLWLSVTAATFCVVVGSWIAWVNVRSSGWLRQVLEGMATLPRVIPKIVMAVALILAWNAPWVALDIYNTAAMLLLAYVAIYITDSLNYANATLRGMGENLEHAAGILGAGRVTVYRRIVLPRLKPALVAAWITTFIVCMRELVASLMLLPPGTDTTATFIFNQFEQGDLSAAMAMATVTIGISTLVLVVFTLRRRSSPGTGSR
ncbi:MAG: iron ABC transporter permease [Gemmatimonadales bacterium]|nr:MAG: iron ABC transporter permease [Gemmatimonadales bacterium]